MQLYTRDAIFAEMWNVYIETTFYMPSAAMCFLLFLIRLSLSFSLMVCRMMRRDARVCRRRRSSVVARLYLMFFVYLLWLYTRLTRFFIFFCFAIPNADKTFGLS